MKIKFYICFIILLIIIIISCTIETTTPRAAILVYHKILKNVSGDDNYARSIDDFESDLNYIKNKNYDIITFRSLCRHIKNKIYLKNPSIVITFDDDIPTNRAIRLLKKFKYKTTIFLKTEISDESTWDDIIALNNYRTDDGKKLFYFESHTHTHPRLSSISDDEVLYQLETSKETLETRLNTTVRYLALPFGDGAYNQKIIEIAKNVGYKGIRTIIYGYEDIMYSDLYSLKAIVMEKNSKINLVLM